MASSAARLVRSTAEFATAQPESAAAPTTMASASPAALRSFISHLPLFGKIYVFPERFTAAR
jgi:hypothetical protein